MCGEKLARTRKSKTEIKIPVPIQRGSKWRIVLRKEGVSATFDTKEEAEAWAKAVRADFIQASKNEPSKSKSFGDALDEYVKLNDGIFSPATIREYKRSKDKELQPLLDKNIYSLTERDLQQFVNDFAKNHAPKTVIDIYHRVLKVVHSVDKDLKFEINLPAKEKPDVYVPTDDDIKAVYNVVKGTKMEIPFLLASCGSLRRGEISALRKADLREGGVYIWRDMVKNSDGEWVEKSNPKTSDSNRTAALPDFVMKMLNDIPGDGNARICNMNPNTITSNFNRLLHRHDLPMMSFHSLRHYWASVAHLNMPDSYVMANGGWSSMDTPRKVYIKIQDAENAKLSKKMDETLTDILHQNLHQEK